MSTPNPLTTASEALGVVKQWRDLETQERVRGASAFRGELLSDARQLSDKTNRVLALLSPWGLETALSGPNPDTPPRHKRLVLWIRARLGRPEAMEEPVRDSSSLPRLSVALMRDADALGEVVEQGRPYIQQVRESANALVPPLGPASKNALDRLLFVEERLLVHLSSVKEFAEQGASARSGEALVEAYLLGWLAGLARSHHEHVRDMLTQDVRDLPGAQPTRKLKRLRKREEANEKLRRDVTVRMLRREADIIDEVLARPR